MCIQVGVKWKKASGLLSACGGAPFRVLLLAAVACPVCFSQEAPSAPEPPGKAVFLRYCAKCHGDRGQGISGIIGIAGPNLQAEHDPGYVQESVELGPSHMPRFAYLLSVDDIHAVSRYVTQNLATIPLSGGDLRDGGRVFELYCASCHRTAVRGGALAFVGTNAPALTGKSAALIAGAIRWGPGPMPAFPASVIDDKELASVVDYIRYAQNPASPGGSAMNWYGPVAEGFAAWVLLGALILIGAWIEKGGKG